MDQQLGFPGPQQPPHVEEPREPRGDVEGDPSHCVNQQYVHDQSSVHVTNQTQNVTHVHNTSNALRAEMEHYCKTEMLDIRTKLEHLVASVRRELEHLVRACNAEAMHPFQHDLENTRTNLGSLGDLYNSRVEHMDRLVNGIEERLVKNLEKTTSNEASLETLTSDIQNMVNRMNTVEQYYNRLSQDCQNVKDKSTKIEKDVAVVKTKQIENQREVGTVKNNMATVEASLQTLRKGYTRVEILSGDLDQRLDMVEKELVRIYDLVSQYPKDCHKKEEAHGKATSQEPSAKIKVEPVQVYTTHVRMDNPGVTTSDQPQEEGADAGPSRREEDAMDTQSLEGAPPLPPYPHPDDGPGGGPGGDPGGGYNPYGAQQPQPPMGWNGDITRLRMPMPGGYTGVGEPTINEWVARMRRWFNAHHIPASEWFNIMRLRIEGRAERWLTTREYEAQNGGRPMPYRWSDLVDELRQQFEPITTTELARRRLRELRQTSTIEAYIRDFQDLIFRVPDMAEADQRSHFIGGLREYLQRNVDAHSGDSLHEAIQMAQRLGRERPQPYRPPSGNQRPYWNPRPGFNRPNRSNRPFNRGNPRPQSFRPRGQWNYQQPPTAAMVQQPSQTHFARPSPQRPQARRRSVKCYLCQGNHFVRDCPRLSEAQRHLN